MEDFKNEMMNALKDIKIFSTEKHEEYLRVLARNEELTGMLIRMSIAFNNASPEIHQEFLRNEESCLIIR